MKRRIKRYYYFALLFLFLPVLFLRAEPSKMFEFIFSVGHEGWIGDFTDYPVGDEAFYDLAWGWENLPVDINDTDKKLSKGLFLSGNNHSDDLFMFVRRQISGLESNTLYDLIFSIIIESNIPSGLFGIGGSPGESVYVKIGAASKEPKKIELHGQYILSVDKGNQSEGGKNARVIGNLANEEVLPQNPVYFPKHLVQKIPLQAKTDENGQIWIFLGSDSGFEGPTKFYIAKVSVNAAKASEDSLDLLRN